MRKTFLLTAILFITLQFSKSQPASPDPFFGANGVAISDFGYETYFTDMAITNDGKIVAAGYTFNGSPNLIVARYDINGTPDVTFSDDGVEVAAFLHSANAVAVQNDGKIILATPSGLVRYNSDGSFDFNFVQAALYSFESIAIQADGKILAVGHPDGGSIFDAALIRFNSDGTIDENFSDNGIQGISFQPRCMAIQSDGKIVVAGDSNSDFVLTRFNPDGTIDRSFSDDGTQTTDFGDLEIVASVAIHTDGKIVVAGNTYVNDDLHICVARYDADGSVDSSFSNDGKQTDNFNTFLFTVKNSIGIQNDGRIIIGGNSGGNSNINEFTFTRFNTDGTIDKTFNENSRNTLDVSEGTDLLYNLIVRDNKLYALGFGEFPDHRGIIAKYLLKDNEPPTVKITSPVNGSKYTANAIVNLSAEASDKNGKVKTVSFYNGDKLIFTELSPPFYRKWFNVKEGDYVITAKAVDNNGVSTTSTSVHIKVLSSSATVNIASPLNESKFSAGTDIVLSANAVVPNGTIAKVEFYEGNNLILTEYKAPYYNKWRKVPAGNYSIIAKATDGNGNLVTSQPVVIMVTNVLNKPAIKEDISNISRRSLNLNVNPNPVANTLNILVKGLKEHTKSTISLISTSGVLLKTIQAKNLNSNTKIDVSSLSAGVYIIKVANGDKIVYKQFVKL
jgi:uncharacterized delta-60 repeat protein